MEPKLIKIDRNGSKHYEGYVKCDRCGGDGIYKWGAIINGVAQYAGTCFKCRGDGRVYSTWIERTPEYQAKLDAQRKARQEKRRAEGEAKYREVQAKQEAERVAREAKIAAEKAVSQYVGEVGKQIEAQVTLEHVGTFEKRSFSGFGTETCYVNVFKDGQGNKLVWMTTAQNVGARFEYGETVKIRGTVKEHREYHDEKQTMLTRCKVI